MRKYLVFSKRVLIAIDEELLRVTDRMAAKKGLGRSELVRCALREYMQREGVEVAQPKVAEARPPRRKRSTSYQSPNYNPDEVVDAYVRVSGRGNEWRFCERDHRKEFDVRQGAIDPDVIPDEIQEKAIELKGQAYGYVEIDPEITKKYGQV